MALDENIEIIGLPETGDFKVVQIFVDGHPIMVCGSSYRGHRDLLKNFLDSREIPYKTSDGAGTSPYLKQERYKVVGMGKAEIRQKNNFFRLPHGLSLYYGISVNAEFRERLKQQFAGWEFKN